MFKKSLKIDGNKLKRQLKEVVSNRLVIVGILVIFLFCLLVYRLFVLQIVEGQEHLDSFNYKVERTIETSGSRGNIYDCNGKLLAYNQLAYSVTLESTDKTEELARERSKEENRDVSENETIRISINLIELLESNGGRDPVRSSAGDQWKRQSHLYGIGKYSPALQTGYIWNKQRG